MQAFVAARLGEFYQTAQPWTRFRGALPVSLERVHLEQICEPDSFVVAKKADGERLLLLFDTLPTGAQVAVCINRRFEIVRFAVTARRALFRGVLLDGELVNTPLTSEAAIQALLSDEHSAAKTFYVFDCIAFDGVSRAKDSYLSRMSYAKEAVALLSSTPQFGISVKHFVPVTDIRSLFDTGAKEQFDADGLVFTPIREAVCLGTQYSLLKWKGAHTIDLLIVTCPDTALLDSRLELVKTSLAPDVSSLLHAARWVTGAFFAEGSSLKSIDQTPVQGRSVTLRLKLPPSVPVLNRLRSLGFSSISAIFECLLQLEPSSGGQPDTDRTLLCQPLRVRTDKNFPNQMSTIAATWTSVYQNIALSELIGRCEGVASL